jgi:hypothetical protein
MQEKPQNLMAGDLFRLKGLSKRHAKRYIQSTDQYEMYAPQEQRAKEWDKITTQLNGKQ